MRAVAVLLLAAAPVAAQGVRVRVVSDSGGAPVPGALVSLRHASRPSVALLTNGAGERVFAAQPDTGYTIETRRVGYRTMVSPPLAVAGADTQLIEVRVPNDRAGLSPPVSTARACRAGDANRAAAGELWEHMHTALLSIEIARAEGAEPMAIRRYERTLGRDGQVLGESYVSGSKLGAHAFRSAPPEQLSRTGFSAVDSLGLAQFLAPDAGVLLSDAFGRDHCFSIVPGEGARVGMIGLRFEPTPGRRVIDVEGALWADAESAQLRLAEFAYRFPGRTEVRGAGGRIMFEQLTTATWIAREWEVRTPVLTRDGRLLGYREEGGEAMPVTPHTQFVMDSVANSRKPPGLVMGTITDSLAGGGLAGATVWLDSSGVSSRTDARGLFFLRGVAPGRHVVQFSHPLLDSLGVRPRAALVTVVPEGMVDVALAGPSLATLKAGACADSLAVVVGLVRDAATGAPVDSAGVTLNWIEIALDEKRRPTLIAQRSTVAHTDASGRYGACVTPNLEVTAYAERGVSRSGRIDLLTEARRLGIQHFWLDLSAADSLKGNAELRGIVKYQDGSPLRNAVVTLTDPELSVTTDTAGGFRLRGIPGGTRVIDARALGHAPVRTVAELKPGEPMEVSVYLRRVTMLDAVLVRAAADGRSAETSAQLAERERRRQGERISATRLRSFRDRRLEDVFRTLSYARVSDQAGPRVTLLDGRGGECDASIWLDGRRSTAAIVMSLRASDVQSLEVMRMRGQVPIEYQEFSNCGAILVWLRTAPAGQ